MNIKQQIDELRKSYDETVKNYNEANFKITKNYKEIMELSDKINKLEKQLQEEQEEDLKPGDIREVWNKSIEDIRIVYFIGRDKFNNCRFSIHKRNIGKPSSGDCFENYKKPSIHNHKVIWSGWMATDDCGDTFVYCKKPKRDELCMNWECIYEPVQVDIVIKK